MIVISLDHLGIKCPPPDPDELSIWTLNHPAFACVKACGSLGIVYASKLRCQVQVWSALPTNPPFDGRCYISIPIKERT